MTRFTMLGIVFVVACGDNGPKQEVPVDAAQPTADAPDTTPLDGHITFSPQVGSAPFACGQTYTAMGLETTDITPRDFRFYASNFQLIAKDGTHVDVQLVQDNTWQYQNVVLLDFENFTGGCQDGTPETNTQVHFTAPAGTYTGVAFDVGIPDVTDHLDLTAQPAPLNLTSLWWGWQYGHIFFAAVTHADLMTNNVASTHDHYFHVGSINCSGDPALGSADVCAYPNRPHFELTGFDPLTHPIVADYGAAIARSKLATGAGCHSDNTDECAFPFDAVGINFVTGSLTPTTQKVFRIDP